MRTTITLDADTAAAVNALQRERHLGVSAATNALIRQGLTARQPEPVPALPSHRLGQMIDVSNIGDVLDMLDRGDLPS